MVVEIAGVKIGDYQGVNLVLLVASLFYHGDRYLLSEDGEIDRGGVGEAIDYALDTISGYGLHLGIRDLSTRESVEKILPFIAEYDLLLFLDSLDPLYTYRGL